MTQPSPARRRFIQQMSSVAGALALSPLLSPSSQAAEEQPAAPLMRTMPFLQNPVNGGITITWLTSSPAYSYVEYGTDKENLTQVACMVDGQKIAGNSIHRIRLQDIQAGVKYYYRVVSQEMLLIHAYKKEFGRKCISDFYEFCIPDAQSDFRVVVFNDTHKHYETVEVLQKLVDDKDYNLALFNGDCIDNPKDLDEVTTVLEHAARVIGKGCVPLVFIRGNHEIRGSYSVFLRDVIEYSTPQSYGAFTWGGTRFVILDCGEDKADDHPTYYGLNDFEQFRKDQVGFLKAEFASDDYKAAKKHVLMHHIPIYSPEGEMDFNPCYDLWHPVLKGQDLDIAINAHTHRFACHALGALGNTFPVMVGGGPKLQQAGVIVLDKRGELLTTSYIASDGEVKVAVKS